MKHILTSLFTLSILVAFIPQHAEAAKGCRSGFVTYKHGNYRCTLGRKDQCINGKWKYKGKCKFFGRFCHHASKSFKHGQVRCINGKKSKCKRGKWKTIGNCPFYCTDGGKLYKLKTARCKNYHGRKLMYICHKRHNKASWRLTNTPCCVYKGKSYVHKKKATINGKSKTCLNGKWK